MKVYEYWIRFLGEPTTYKGSVIAESERQAFLTVKFMFRAFDIDIVMVNQISY